MLTNTTIHNRLRTLVARIIFEAEYLKKNKISEAEALLQELVNKLGEFVDHRKVA